MTDRRFSRRGFISTASAGVAALGLSSLASTSKAEMKSAGIPATTTFNNADAWFDHVKGKHRIVYDVESPSGMMPFAWSRVFLATNAETGTPPEDCGVVVVFRHRAMPYGLNSELWKKYKFGERMKIEDPRTRKIAMRNPFWDPAPNDFDVPGVGDMHIGMHELQKSGVMFCICHMAMKANSAMVAMKLKREPEEVLAEFMDGVLPGVQVVPSGVWAVGRAQEHGCTYCWGA